MDTCDMARMDSDSMIYSSYIHSFYYLRQKFFLSWNNVYFCDSCDTSYDNIYLDVLQEMRKTSLAMGIQEKG